MAPPVCLARAQFEHLAEQHQHGDDRGGFEVDRDDAAVCRKLCRKQPRRERRDEAVEVGGADAERDQGEHVEPAVANGRPAAHEERPAGPQHHRRGEHELKPHRRSAAGCSDAGSGPGRCAPIARTTERDRERRADPEAPGHVDELGVRPGLVGRDASGSSAMPQIGQEPGPSCADLRDASGRCRSTPGRSLAPTSGCRAVRQILFRIGGELARGIRPSRRNRRDHGGCGGARSVRIDLHAADRVAVRSFGTARVRSVVPFSASA